MATMNQPKSSGDWAKAIRGEREAGRISDAEALTAFLLSTVINWRPTDPERKGRAALYWKNREAADALKIGWRTFERHRSALRKVGLIATDARGNLVPRNPVKADADKIDAVKADGPYEEPIFKDSLFKESFEEVEATVNLDGAPVNASVQQPWPSAASHGSSLADKASATGTEAQVPGWNWAQTQEPASA